MNETGASDSLLAGVARHLMACGWQLAGVVQINSERAQRHLCDMDVQVLPGGPVIRISQDLGTHARGCRLDQGALDEAARRVEARLNDRTDLLILNKFGKYEAEGRGFRNVIAEALSRGIPVLTGVNALNKAAFGEFSGEFAEFLPAAETDILAAIQGFSEQILQADVQAAAPIGPAQTAAAGQIVEDSPKAAPEL